MSITALRRSGGAVAGCAALLLALAAGTAASAATPQRTPPVASASRSAGHPPLSVGQRVAVVTVPGGRQAAVYDQQGHLSFWRQPKAVGRWLLSGTSTYPLLPGGSPSAARVSAVHLAGMSTAVFIANGIFTGDGSADWLAFGRGSPGWGRLSPVAGRLVPTGKRSTDNTTPGLAAHIQDFHGLLETSQLPDVVSFAQGGALTVNRFWRWAGSSFVSDHDNIATAGAGHDPQPDTTRVSPLGSCPATLPDGDYAALAAVSSNQPRRPFSFNAGVTLTVELSAPGGHGRCAFTLPAAFTISVPMRTTVGVPPDRTHLADIRWLTGPAWLLSTSGSLGDVRDSLSSSGVSAFRPRGVAPYFIPTSAGVTGFALPRSPSAPDRVHATISGGRLTALAVQAAIG